MALPAGKSPLIAFLLLCALSNSVLLLASSCAGGGCNPCGFPHPDVDSVFATFYLNSPSNAQGFVSEVGKQDDLGGSGSESPFPSCANGF